MSSWAGEPSARGAYSGTGTSSISSWFDFTKNDRKKVQTRRRLADVAARMFAERGYDAVSIADVARGADVSDQTVYNYIPAKQDLVLDRAEEIRERYGRVVRERDEGVSPARALEPLVLEDIDRYRHADPVLARGEFPAQCVSSAVLRRFALEAREQQARTIAESITATDPGVPALIAHAHAAALVAVVQFVTDRIGTCVLDGAAPGCSADDMRAAAQEALDVLDRTRP